MRIVINLSYSVILFIPILAHNIHIVVNSDLELPGPLLSRYVGTAMDIYMPANCCPQEDSVE
jgi:hypothetical protein